MADTTEAPADCFQNVILGTFSEDNAPEEDDLIVSNGAAAEQLVLSSPHDFDDGNNNSRPNHARLVAALRQAHQDIARLQTKLHVADARLRVYGDCVRQLARHCCHTHQKKNDNDDDEAATMSTTMAADDDDDDDDNNTVVDAAVEAGEFNNNLSSSITTCQDDHDDDAASSSTNVYRCRTFSNMSDASSIDAACFHHRTLLTASQQAELLSLENAVHMLHDHAELAGQEAALNVHDLSVTTRERALYREQCQALQADVHHLQTVNGTLQHGMDKLVAERRVLIKEVRKLRSQVACSQRQSVLQQMETYVVNALSLHEYQLRANETSREVSGCCDVVENGWEDAATTTTTAGASNNNKPPPLPPAKSLGAALAPWPATLKKTTKLSSGLAGGVALGFGYQKRKFQPSVVAQSMTPDPMPKTEKDTQQQQKPAKPAKVEPYVPLRLNATTNDDRVAAALVDSEVQSLAHTSCNITEDHFSDHNDRTVPASTATNITTMHTPEQQPRHPVAILQDSKAEDDVPIMPQDIITCDQASLSSGLPSPSLTPTMMRRRADDDDDDDDAVVVQLEPKTVRSLAIPDVSEFWKRLSKFADDLPYDRPGRS